MVLRHINYSSPLNRIHFSFTNPDIFQIKTTYINRTYQLATGKFLWCSNPGRLFAAKQNAHSKVTLLIIFLKLTFVCTYINQISMA
jgi:hypothetical protein